MDQTFALVCCHPPNGHIKKVASCVGVILKRCRKCPKIHYYHYHHYLIHHHHHHRLCSAYLLIKEILFVIT